MVVRAKVEPIDRDISLILNEELSPAAQSRQLAQFARESIEEAKGINQSILGRVPRHRTFVDGRDTADFESVRPNGVIVGEFELVDDVLIWIASQLEKHSPVKSGRYQRSHTLFADGVEIEVGTTIPNASEFVFISTVPYARKLERGSSSQAPDGVYQAVATLARARFGNIARIGFSYRTVAESVIVGGPKGNESAGRNPAIIVTV